MWFVYNAYIWVYYSFKPSLSCQSQKFLYYPTILLVSVWRLIFATPLFVCCLRIRSVMYLFISIVSVNMMLIFFPVPCLGRGLVIMLPLVFVVIGLCLLGFLHNGRALSSLSALLFSIGSLSVVSFSCVASVLPSHSSQYYLALWHVASSLFLLSFYHSWLARYYGRPRWGGS